jgi:RNA polymerase sigma-70 factor (ECF subfamily)
LIDRARGGCAQAMGELLEACRDYLLLVANSELDHQLRGKLGGSDLVQDTFVHAHRAIQHFRGNSERELLAWLRKILRNQVALARRNYLDTDKRDIARELPLRGDGSTSPLGIVPICSRLSPSRQVANAEEVMRVDAAIARLPLRYGRVIQLRSRDLLSFDQIGVILEINGAAARKLWVRAILRLQRELGGSSSG